MNKYVRFLTDRTYYRMDNSSFVIETNTIVPFIKSYKHGKFFKHGKFYGINLEGDEYFIDAEQAEVLSEQQKLIWETLYGDFKEL